MSNPTPLSASAVELLTLLGMAPVKRITTEYITRGESEVLAAVSSFDTLGSTGRTVDEGWKVKAEAHMQARKFAGIMAEVCLRDLQGKSVNAFQRRTCPLALSQAVEARIPAGVKPSKAAVATAIRDLIAECMAAGAVAQAA